MEVSHAKALITVDGARRKGKTAPVKAAVDGDGRARVSRAHRRRAPHRHRSADERAARRFPMTRSSPRRTTSVRPSRWRPSTRCSSCTAPALQRSRRGSCTHRRVPDRRQHHPSRRVRPRPRARRVLLLGGRWLGDGALLHRLWPAVQRRHWRDVRGRAGLPAQGDLVGADRALRRDDLLHRPDRDPGVHEVGSRAPQRARPVESAAVGHSGRADQPKGVAVVPRRDRP
jgi:hypothetical protein